MEKKYKIFGKINVIDFFVIIILICAVILGVFIISGKLNNNSGQNIRLTFTAKEVSDFVIEKVEDGCRMYDDTEKVDLGRCTNIEIADSFSSIVTDDGSWIIADKPDYSSIVLQSETVGQKLDNGVEIGGQNYFIGDFIVLRAGIAKIYIEITGIEIIE
jgi:hypothetical protein